MILAEFITIENNTITGVFSGEVDENRKDIIILPRNHMAREGDTLEYYNKDWSRKNEAELIKMGLEKCPDGYILDGKNIREMTEDEKIIAGIVECPQNKKIAKGKVVPKTETELWREKTSLEKANIIREKRNNMLQEADNQMLAYHEQIELGILEKNDKYRKAILEYKQQLRDITRQGCFPNSVLFPMPPIYEDYI